MKRKRKDFEIRFYEGLVKQQPGFVQALASLGDAYTRKGFYQEGLAIDQRLAELKPQDPIVHYNLACSLSLVGQLAQALAALKQAVLLGYDEISYISKDPDLKALRETQEFKQFFKKIEKL